MPIVRPRVQPSRLTSVVISILYVVVGALPLAYAVADAVLDLQKEALFRIAMWPYEVVGLVIIGAGVSLFQRKRWARWAFLLVACTFLVWLCYALFIYVDPYFDLARSGAKNFPGWPVVLEIAVRGTRQLFVICLVTWLAAAFVFSLKSSASA
jgi:hypothetical protein